MAVKIRMLKRRVVPVVGIEFDVDVELKVNNEVGEELVLKGDAEYVDPELAARFKQKWPEPEKQPEPEIAMAEPEENAMMPKPKPRKYGKRK